MVIQVVLSQAG